MREYFKNFKHIANPITGLIIAILTAALLTLVDYFNLISKLFSLFNQPYVILLFVVALLVIILGLFYIHPFSQLKNKSVTGVDLFCLRLELALLFYLVTSLCLCGYNWIKTGLLVGIIICIACFLIIRMIIFKHAFKLVSKNENRIIDLKSVYENVFPKDDGLPIFISEKDVDYDLLDRQPIINKLVSSIQNYNTDGSFVIGLNGSWGSGKTTIINNVKKILKRNHKNIVIDEFDPWLYENQDALLVAMFESIIKEVGIKYSYSNLTKVCNIIKRIIGLSKNGDLFSNVFSIIAPEDKNYVETLKEKFNNFLSINDKFVVVVIDNIERANADNVIFLFKLIGTLFDLKRVTYVLLYDKERLNKIFEDTKKIDCHYIEKIIQQEISIPMMSKNKRNEVLSTCFCNMLEYYHVNKSDIPRYNFIWDFLSNEIEDLRTFKRLINSTFATVFCEDNYLYKPDLLALEIVRFLDGELYYAIHRNRKFFISSDQIIEESASFVQYLLDKFNQEGKVFFKELFANKKEGIKKLLASVFPYVNRFLSSVDLEPKNLWRDNQYPSIQTNGKACSAKFFDLYFCYGANEYLAIKEDVKEFVELCNKTNKLSDLLSTRLLKINVDYQEEWFSMFQFHLSEVQEDKLLDIIAFLIVHLDSIDDKFVFLSSNAVQRVTYIIAIFLKSCSDINFKSFLQFIDEKYNRLRMLGNLIYHLDNDIEANKYRGRIQELKRIFEKMCEQIIVNDINLYDDECYRMKNIYALYDYLKDGNKKMSFQDYIVSVMSKKTIIRILGDVMTESISGTYNYYVSKQYYSDFFGDKDILGIVEEAEIETDSQQFVKKVYLHYLNGEVNHFGEKSLSYNQPVRFNL